MDQDSLGMGFMTYKGLYYFIHGCLCRGCVAPSQRVCENHHYTITFSTTPFIDMVQCDVMSLDCVVLIFSHPYQHDHRAIYDVGRINQYTLF